MKKIAVRVVVILLIGAALAVAALVYQANRKEELGARLLQEFKQDLSRAGMGDQGQRYAAGLADHFHPTAYDASFGPEAPALGGTTDVNAYQRALMAAIIAQAKADGQFAYAAALEEFKKSGSTLDLTGTP